MADDTATVPTGTTIDAQYEDLLRRIMATGAHRGDRTGTGTRSVFGAQLRYDLSKSFPAITTKRVFLRGVFAELLWFISGDSNIRALRDQNVHIWDDWVDEHGDLGPVYGVQWRSWPTPDGKHIDQLAQLLDHIRETPDSRRLLVSAWNVAQLDQMALMPCHLLFQVYIADSRLSLQVYQRSCDMFLGVPFNIASYSALAMMLAQQTGYEPGELVWTGGDCHIYDNHVTQVQEQLKREPYPFPKLKLHKAADLFSYTPEDFEVVGYQHHATIKAPIAV
ncbi:MAG: thymidylate synthase [Varibaculum sp.]|nr:thymidylate synthase [Varibaculum sp.]